jgi:hypothetical protein
MDLRIRLFTPAADLPTQYYHFYPDSLKQHPVLPLLYHIDPVNLLLIA